MAPIYEIVAGTSYLYYKSQTAEFTVGDTLTGGTSGDTATIVGVSDRDTTGALILSSADGAFVSGETITDGAGGSATADGTLAQGLISTEDMKLHLRVDIDDDDDLIDAYTQAATAHVEMFCRDDIVPRVYDWYMDAFPADGAQFPTIPVASVASIKYLDEDGNEQTVDSDVYRVDTASQPSRIFLDYDQSWPSSLYGVNNQVYIRFTTYPKFSDERHLTAVRLLVGNWYENREAVVIGSGTNELPLAVKSLLWGCRREVLV